MNKRRIKYKSISQGYDETLMFNLQVLNLQPLPHIRVWTEIYGNYVWNYVGAPGRNIFLCYPQ